MLVLHVKFGSKLFSLHFALLTCETALTVAEQIHGPPKNPPRQLMRQRRTMSQWRPTPFLFWVFSNMISLGKGNKVGIRQFSKEKKISYNIAFF